MSHRRSIWVHCILTVPGGRMPRKRWRPRWPLSLIRAGHGLRLKAVTSVFADPDDYVRVHACVRVDQRHLQYLPPQQVGVIISELKFSSQELTNAFSVNHFLLGLDSLLSSAMATGHLKTQAAWLRRFENICSSREMKVKKNHNIVNVAFFVLILNVTGSKWHSKQRTLRSNFGTWT